MYKGQKDAKIRSKKMNPKKMEIALERFFNDAETQVLVCKAFNQWSSDAWRTVCLAAHRSYQAANEKVKKIKEPRVTIVDAKIDDLEAELEARCNTLDNKCAGYEEALRISDAKKEELKNQITELSVANVELGNTVRELQEALQRAGERTIKNVELVGEYNSRINNYKAKIGSLKLLLKEKQNKLEAAKNNYNVLRESFDASSEEIQELEANLEGKTEELKDLGYSVTHLEGKIKTQDDLIASLYTKIQTLENQLFECTASKAEVENLENRVQGLEWDVENRENIIQGKNSEMEELQGTIYYLRDKIQELEAKLDPPVATLTVHDPEVSVDLTRMDLAEMIKENAEAAELRNEIQRVQERNRELDEELADFEIYGIKGHRTTERKEYLVEWMPTWEPEENISEEALATYKKSLERKASLKRKWRRVNH